MWYLISWWRDLDKILLSIIILICVSGLVLVATGSTYVAERVGLYSYYFLYNQLIYMILTINTIVIFSFLPERSIRKICSLGFCIFICLMLFTLFFGIKIKGARRWVNILGFSIQPSEFIKPFFSVVLATLIQHDLKKVIFFVYILVILLLLLQPDFGMSVIITLIFFTQLFVSGWSILNIIISGIIPVIAGALAFAFLPHVKLRIMRFINSISNDISGYQVKKSLDAFKNGGMLGVGPGEGVVKMHLPDAHTDFIFAVAGEEFGLLFCTFLVFLFFVFITRVFIFIYRTKNTFHVVALSGLIIQFAMQTIFNLGVSLNLFPTKGMTLPFVSYGGSSLLSSGITVGIILSLCHKVVVIDTRKYQ